MYNLLARILRKGMVSLIPNSSIQSEISLIRRDNMNKEIQPNYVEVKFVCACGAEFDGKTSKPGVKAGDVVKLEVCDKCHPFFTGQQKLVDTEGRVDKFNKKHNLK